MKPEGIIIQCSRADQNGPRPMSQIHHRSHGQVVFELIARVELQNVAFCVVVGPDLVKCEVPPLSQSWRITLEEYFAHFRLFPGRLGIPAESSMSCPPTSQILEGRANLSLQAFAVSWDLMKNGCGRSWVIRYLSSVSLCVVASSRCFVLGRVTDV